MKPWMKNRNKKVQELMYFIYLNLTNSGINLQINATSYIDFFTLITYTSFITYTYNYITCADYFIIVLIITIHCSTPFLFLKITSSLLHN